MKLRKKLVNRKKTQWKIKEVYLRKLSLEMIKRGISNKIIKSTLNEVALSLDEFISETKPKDIEDLEQNFGNVDQFCENNMFVYSSEGVLGQVVSSVFIILSLLALPTLGLTSFFLPPYRLTIAGFRERFLAISIANLGLGFLGTLFGLNMCLWLIYMYYKDRYSPYDYREKIKFIILGVYWFIVCIWLILALIPYTLFSDVIIDIWTEGLKSQVIEGATRWLLMGVFLISTASIYTRKLVKTKSKREEKTSKIFWIDEMKVIFVFFILTGFVLPNPGMGILILFIGTGILLFSKINGGALFLGILAILVQVFVIGKNADMYGGVGINAQIVFGIKTIIGLGSLNDLWTTIIVPICLLIAWSTICIILIRKRKVKFFPRFKIPTVRNLIKSSILLAVIIFSSLGSQPQYTKYRVYYEGYQVPEPDGPVVVFDFRYHIDTKGTVYLSLYTYVNSWESYEAQGIDLKGNWTVTWSGLNPRTMFTTVTTYRGSFDDDPLSVISVNQTRYSGIRYKIELTYLVFEVRTTGDLKVYYEFLINTARIVFPYHEIFIESKVPWFPSWIEIFIVTVTASSLFLSWEKDKEIKPPGNSRKERK